jgi:hypothetical protein
MASETDSLERAKRTALSAVSLATLFVVALLLLPVSPTIRSAAALIGAWLLVASLIRYAGLHRRLSMPTFRRPIPIRFSGNLGRFTLRSRGDGRRVEVRAGGEVVAEAIATDERDELVVDLEAVDDADIDALGAAIGEAIEMVVVADEDRPAERRIAGPRSWGRRPRQVAGGVLRTIGSRPH